MQTDEYMLAKRRRRSRDRSNEEYSREYERNNYYRIGSPYSSTQRVPSNQGARLGSLQYRERAENVDERKYNMAPRALHFIGDS
jgi:hypothetical protein